MRRRGISEATKDKYKKSMGRVINNLSRTVMVYKQSIRNECPNCYYDNLTNKSTGRCKWTAIEAPIQQAAWESGGNVTLRYKYFVRGRCPICSGQGYLETLRKTYVKCLVNWAPTENDIVQTPAGLSGATPVLLKTDPKYFDLFKNCDKIIIDGVECLVSTPPLLRGLGNESVLFVIAFTAATIKEPPSSEFRKGYYD